MARPERFELPTTWFEAKYSIQLSYGRIVCLRWTIALLNHANATRLDSNCLLGKEHYFVSS